MNSLNELSTVTNGRSLTVVGATTTAATNVTVNGFTSALYGDALFAKAGFTIMAGTNTFTAIAADGFGRRATNAVMVNLPVTNNFTNDLNGNLLSDGNRCFAYDDDNELISVWVTNLWRNDFVYDGKLRRRIAREYVWGTGASAWTQTKETHYLYDGNLVVQERDINNAPLVTYTRGLDLTGTLNGAGGIGGLLARTENAKLAVSDLSGQSSTLYHSDGNGNVTCLIFTNQLMAANYLYDPFGNTIAKAGSLGEANVYRFSSKEWNANSGLYYYLYRFYDPNLQRWPNRDPLGEGGFETLQRWIFKAKQLPFQKPNVVFEGPDLYAYVQNDPMNQYDLYGLHNAADCEAWKESCDDGCRSMPSGTSWQRFLKRSCWAKCMSEYAACLSTTETTLCCIGGAVAVGACILFPPAAPVILSPVGL